MDKITKSLMEEFLAVQELTHLSEADGFERFANYCVISSEHSDSIDIEEVSSPNSEVGIDGIAVLVNGVLVTDPEEVEGLAQQNGYLEVNLIFIQAKRSESFSESAIGTFAFAVRDFFSEHPSLPETDFLKRYLAIKEAIYEQSTKFSRGLPRLQMFFVTTGKWMDDQVLASRIATEKTSLEELTLFEDVAVVPIGAQELQKLYFRTKNPVEREFIFPNRVTLPEIDGVSEAYLGVIPAKEYLKLVTDDAGQIRKSLFYDNVRDYQGDNPVNRDIAATLQSDASERFAILNNGVTIVARELRTTGDKLYVKDYQIVNGGQTTHVLFNERDGLDESVTVPIKVVSTGSEDLITEVVTATNSQTAIKAEELNARAEFERRLEQFFAAYPEPQRLYYERRSKQYDSQEVERVRIISRQQMVRSFASTYLDEPHRATGYVPQLMVQLGDELFNDIHRLEPYYASAYAYYKLEFFWRNQQLDRSFKPGRWQILMAARHIANGGLRAPLNSTKISSEANALCEYLWDDEKALELFKTAADIVRDATVDIWDRDIMRNQPTTQKVLELLGDDDGQ
jgi:hypothetical protein